MEIRKVKLPFLSCGHSTLIECSAVDKDTAEEIAIFLCYELQEFYTDLDFVLGSEFMGSWIDGDLSLYIDEGSKAEARYIALGGEEWIKKLLTEESKSV